MNNSISISADHGVGAGGGACYPHSERARNPVIGRQLEVISLGLMVSRCVLEALLFNVF